MRKRHIFLRSILGLLAILFLLPLVLTLIYSFCSPAEIKEFMGTRNQYGKQLMEIKFSPEMFSLDQYWRVLIQDTSILRYYFNSIMYTVAILLGQAVVIPMLAYALSRFSFRGRDVIAFAVIVLLLLPFQVTMVPTVLTLRSIGLMDTMWAIILPSLASPFYVFLLRQSMVGIPGELFEAAQIDGAGPIRCYFHIALPVSKAIIGAAVALSFADCWNMVEQPLVFLPMREDLHPLSVAFNQLSQESTGIEFAGATLYILPALMIYLFFQKDIMTGIQLSEMK